MRSEKKTAQTATGHRPLHEVPPGWHAVGWFLYLRHFAMVVIDPKKRAPFEEAARKLAKQLRAEGVTSCFVN